MRAVWTGAITFGLVNVPVKAYSAVEDHDVSFHQVHDADGGRIRYERRCEVCGKKVEYENIDKAYDDGDDTVIITEEDLETLPEADNEEIEVVQFVPSEQVDPIMLERSYYLEPEGKSPKSYLLLRQTLEATDRTAIVRFALRQKTRLGALRVDGKVLVLQGLLWADEVREVDFPNTKSRAKISDQELELSAALVDQYASDFTPEKFEDEYQVQLRKLIDAKFESGDTIDTEATFGEVADADGGDGDGDSDEGEDAEVIDLMEALKASLGKRRGGGSGDSAKKKDSGSGKSCADKEDTGGTDDKKSDKSGDGKKTAKKSASKSKKKSSGSKSAGPKSSDKKSSGSKSSAKKSPTKKSSGKKSGKSGGKSAKSSGSGKKSGEKSACAAPGGASGDAPADGAETEPRVPVVPPAPAHLRRILAVLPVAAGAVGNPQGRGARIEGRRLGGLLFRQARGDGHETGVSRQHRRRLQHPVDALGQGHRLAAAVGEFRQRFGRRPVAHVIAPGGIWQRVDGGVRHLHARPREGSDIGHVLDDETPRPGIVGAGGTR